jgi:hypothetical protein
MSNYASSGSLCYAVFDTLAHLRFIETMTFYHCQVLGEVKDRHMQKSAMDLESETFCAEIQHFTGRRLH